MDQLTGWLFDEVCAPDPRNYAPVAGND